MKRDRQAVDYVLQNNLKFIHIKGGKNMNKEAIRKKIRTQNLLIEDMIQERWILQRKIDRKRQEIEKLAKRLEEES